MRKVKLNLSKREERDFDNFISNRKLKILGIDFVGDDTEHPGYAIYQEVYKHKDFPGKCWVGYSSYRPEWIEKWKSV